MSSGITHFEAINPRFEALTAVAGAVTGTQQTGLITTESLTTAAGSVYQLTMTNARIGSNSAIIAQAAFGSATLGSPALQSATVTANGTAVIVVENAAVGAVPYNGTLKVAFWILNPVNT